MSLADSTDRSRRSLLSPVREIFQAEWERTVPPHTNIFHYLGALALFFLLVQIGSGIMLMIYYRASGPGAYYSTGIIMDEVVLGWFVRSLHHWGSHLVIALLLLHMVRVYFSRAYQAPRQLNWAVGVVLLALMLGLGFTGTLLPADQYAYWYTDSARRTIAEIPVVGNLLLGLFWGGWDVGEEVLVRFYAFHVGILPWLAISFLGIHFLLVWRFGIREPDRARKAVAAVPTPFFPDFLINLLMSIMLIGGLLLSAAVLLPASLLAPADPLSPLPRVQPQWYLLAPRELLRHLPRSAAAISIVLSFVVLLLVPLLDRKAAAPVWKKVIQRGLGLAVVGAWAFLSISAYLR